MQEGPRIAPHDRPTAQMRSAFDLYAVVIEGLWVLLRGSNAAASEFSGGIFCFCRTMHRVFYFRMGPLSIWLIEILKVLVRERALDPDKPRFARMHGCLR